MSAHDAPDGTALQPRITTFEEAEEIRPFGTPARIMLRTEIGRASCRERV